MSIWLDQPEESRRVEEKFSFSTIPILRYNPWNSSFIVSVKRALYVNTYMAENNYFSIKCSSANDYTRRKHIYISKFKINFTITQWLSKFLSYISNIVDKTRITCRHFENSANCHRRCTTLMPLVLREDMLLQAEQCLLTLYWLCRCKKHPNLSKL